MKLGEALTRRKDLINQLIELRNSISNTMQIEVNKKTKIPIEVQSEDPIALLIEHDLIQSDLRDLIARINLTNTNTNIYNKSNPSGINWTISDMIAHRDYLGSMIKAYKTFMESSRINKYDFGDLPNKYDIAKMRKEGVDIEDIETVRICVIPYLDLKKKHDEFSKQHREVDITLQEANWNTDLVE